MILHKYFWADAINNACHVLNRMVIRPILEKTLYELPKGGKPNISYFHVFGCKCFISYFHSQSMTRVKSNRREQDFFYICDLSHSLHLIWIMQHCDLNHKFHEIWITHLMLATASIDSNHIFYVTRVTRFFTFSYLVMTNLTWVELCTWLELWPFMTQIKNTTWLES